MIISLRVNDEDGMLIKAYAIHKGKTVSDLVRTVVLEHLETDYRVLPMETGVVKEESDYQASRRNNQ